MKIIIIFLLAVNAHAADYVTAKGLDAGADTNGIYISNIYSREIHYLIKTNINVLDYLGKKLIDKPEIYQCNINKHFRMEGHVLGYTNGQEILETDVTFCVWFSALEDNKLNFYSVYMSYKTNEKNIAGEIYGVDSKIKSVLIDQKLVNKIQDLRDNTNYIHYGVKTNKNLQPSH